MRLLAPLKLLSRGFISVDVPVVDEQIVIEPAAFDECFDQFAGIPFPANRVRDVLGLVDREAPQRRVARREVPEQLQGAHRSGTREP